MSRRYYNSTQVSGQGVTKESKDALESIFMTLWALDDCYELLPAKGSKKCAGFVLSGESSLAGGEGEEDAHARFVQAFREEFPGCAVQTQWSYLDDPPTNTYTTDEGEEI